MKQFRVLFIINAIIVTSLAIATAMILSQITGQQKQAALSNGVEIARSYAQEISVFLEHNKTTAENLAVFMSNYSSGNRKEINLVLEQLLRMNPNFLGTYVGYEPNAFDNKDSEYVNKPAHDTTGRFIPYWNRIDNNKITLSPLLEYNTSDWYLIPKRKLAPQIFAPFLHKETLMTSFVFPIIKEDQFQGISGVDISLKTIHKIVLESQVYDTGYAFLISQNGSFLAHPNSELINIGKKINEYGNETNTPELLDVYKKIENKESGYVELIDPHSGKEAFLFFEPISIGNWGIIISIPRKELLVSVNSLMVNVILVFLATLTFITLVTYFITLHSGKSIREVIDIVGNLTQGNLQNKTIINGKDEFARLGMSINEFIDYLHDFVQKIQSVCFELQKSVNKVHKEGENLSERAIKEADAINLFKQNIIVTRSMIDETVQTTAKAENQIQQIESTMVEIEETNNKMSEVLKIIDDITFETNLLAINAAVEAAHVGDIGKGFEVVADEIRLLSKRTEIQSKEVGLSINQNIQKINNNVEAISSVTESISEITISSEQQANAMKEISESVVEIDSFTRQSINLVNELKSTSAKINTYTQDLLNLVQFFKIKK